MSEWTHFVYLCVATCAVGDYPITDICTLTNVTIVVALSFTFIVCPIRQWTFSQLCGTITLCKVSPRVVLLPDSKSHYQVWKHPGTLEDILTPSWDLTCTNANLNKQPWLLSFQNWALLPMSHVFVVWSGSRTSLCAETGMIYRLCLERQWDNLKAVFRETEGQSVRSALRYSRTI